MALAFRMVSWLFHCEPWCLQYACRVYAPTVSKPRWQGRFSTPSGPSPPTSTFLKDVVGVTLVPLPGCPSFESDPVRDLWLLLRDGYCCSCERNVDFITCSKDFYVYIVVFQGSQGAQSASKHLFLTCLSHPAYCPLPSRHCHVVRIVCGSSIREISIP